MEPPSASPRAGRGPWQELLLAVSLLAFWNPPTTAQVTMESVPPNAAEGKDTLLRVLNLPGDTASLAWFKGETVLPAHRILLYVIDTNVTTPGPAYTGRETIYPNGSLLFQNITLNDTGSYILQIINRKFEIALARGQLRVFQPVSQPLLTGSSTTVTEDDSVFLTCSSSNTGVSIQWFFNDHILMLTDRMKLSQDNSTLTIDPVRKEDAGKYKCEVSNPVSFRKSDAVRLDVEDERSTVGHSVRSIIGIALGVLLGLALVAALGCLLLRTRSRRVSDLKELRSPASTPGHGAASRCTYPDSLPSPTAAIPIYQELQHPDTSIYCRINHKAEVASYFPPGNCSFQEPSYDPRP
uniref:carcinoembryonic antigen-related cell adhesion molecule 4-like isoform X2 n=1 Tax=Nyctereutes procyonoides TaxID=34880 RepID=UPI0024445473|nr:carcinoembryonic antigen-related cell adhesion molecule 4-like isoform X2 [Nyctereutes procyonoides]